MTTSRYRALCAAGLTVDKILALSPRQIFDLYSEPTGEISEPKDEDKSARLSRLLALISTGQVKASPEKVAVLQERLKGLLDGRTTKES